MAEYVLNVDSIAAVPVEQGDYDLGPHVTLAEVERDALVADLRRLRAIEDMARFVLAEHDMANTRPKADGNALGHAHRNPPKWDDRDGVCTWCVSVAALRHALGADRG